jgi:hypothetical protein
MIKRRQRFRQLTSLKDRLAAFAKEAREKATVLPPGFEREEMLKEARQADIAFDLDDQLFQTAVTHLSGEHS